MHPPTEHEDRYAAYYIRILSISKSRDFHDKSKRLECETKCIKNLYKIQDFYATTIFGPRSRRRTHDPKFIT